MTSLAFLDWARGLLLPVANAVLNEPDTSSDFLRCSDAVGAGGRGGRTQAAGDRRPAGDGDLDLEGSVFWSEGVEQDSESGSDVSYSVSWSVPPLYIKCAGRRMAHFGSRARFALESGLRLRWEGCEASRV